MSFEYFDDFWIRKLVFINSAGSANVELPMSVMGLLLGRNNVGKTSGISALKLFILPETNFKSCKEKFAFISNNEYHEAHESANFYFPSDRSFIICEAENTKGPFCMILHRSNEEWGYARIVVPAEYEKIKHLFWEFDGQFNAGFGRNLPELSLQSVKEGLKSFKPEFLTRPDEIREAIYSRPGPVDNLSRYCLIPLNQKGEKREVEALRALLNLAFRISGADKLAGAIASIIETENAGKDGNLSVDILEINREFEELKVVGERLRCVGAMQPIWQTLNSAYKQYVREREQFCRNLGILLCEELSLKEVLDAQISAENEELEKVSDILREANNQVSSAKSKLDSLKGNLDEKNKDIQRHNESIKLINHYWGKYKSVEGIDTLQDLVEYLQDQLPELNDEISACEDKEEAKKQLEGLNKSRQEKAEQIDDLEKEQKNDARYSLESVGAHGRSVLYSLNPAFGHMKCIISADQTTTVDEFAKLFEIKQGQVRFLDEPMGVYYQVFDPELVRSQRKEKLQALKNDHHKLLQRIKHINEIAKGTPGDLSELKNEREEIQQVLRKLVAHDHISEELKNKEYEIEKLTQEEIPLAESIFIEASDRLSDAKIHKVDVDRKISDLGVKKSDLYQYSNKLHSARYHLDQFFRDESLHQSVSPTPSSDHSDINSFGALIEDFESQCNVIKGLKREIFENLKVLSNEPSLSEQRPIDLEVDVGFDSVRKRYEDLRAIFENYEDNLIKYRNDIESHNNQTGVRAAAINEIGKLIETTKSSINRELARFKISNLSAIELIIDVDPRFTELRDDMDSISFSGDQLLNESIYQRLNKFCEDFFKGIPGYGKRIQLDKIITGIRYKVAVDGITMGSQQSTGTTGMINTVLLALLLKRMVPKNGVRLHFPIIFDEVLNLDSVNLKTIKRVVADNNFVLFVVCPNNAGIVADAIPNWYDLSLHSLSEGLMVQRCEVLHFGLTETLIDETTSTQISEESV